jgi:hypothetical protein
MLRIPHCLANRLTDGGKVVSPTHRPLLYSPETLFLCFWYSFLLEATQPNRNPTVIQRNVLFPSSGSKGTKNSACLFRTSTTEMVIVYSCAIGVNFPQTTAHYVVMFQSHKAYKNYFPITVVRTLCSVVIQEATRHAN